MIDPSFLDEIGRLSLVVNRNVYSKYSGEHRSPASGGGTLFKEHRIYTPSDNFKAIDWKVYARTDDLYVKLFEEERNLNVHILIDSSKSMSMDDKFDFAGKIGLGFGYLAAKNNEKVNFSVFSDTLEMLKGAKGNKQVTSMLSALNQIKKKGNSKIYDSIQRYKNIIHSKSYIVIISDFMMNIEEISEALHLLGKTHIIKLIQVLSKEEKEMKLEGDFKLIDSESEKKLRTYISKRAQKKYLENLKEHESKLNLLANEFPNTKFYQFSSDQKIYDVMFKITSGRF